jgi:hypothetical protein
MTDDREQKSRARHARRHQHDVCVTQTEAFVRKFVPADQKELTVFCEKTLLSKWTFHYYDKGTIHYDWGGKRYAAVGTRDAGAYVAWRMDIAMRITFRFPEHALQEWQDDTTTEKGRIKLLEGVLSNDYAPFFPLFLFAANKKDLPEGIEFISDEDN